ncbi:MAG TPA: GMC family oxidoreductase [Polyangiaceae bacterium]|nr:GMC family oxidoreductase [Polyangiaceae bacterium]
MTARELPVTGAVVLGRDLDAAFDETCDVVIVGSGAGGAVLASVLSEAGLSVIVLEEGPYYTPQEYGSFRPTESMRRIWREAGLLAAFGLGQTPVIGLSAGRCVGGSSVLTGGVCFRIPSEVHAEWVRDLGLTDLSEASFEPVYREVERRVRVREVPADMRSASTDKFVEGAAKLGIPMHPLKRNTEGCVGNGRCNFGCPSQAKMSVDVSYLPSALRNGARVIADALVERIEIEEGRATGILGRILGGPGGKASRPFRVRARAVVAACGTLHTPVLLFNSGIGRRAPALGRNVTLHPALRVSALFDDVLTGWNGALQSVYSDHFAAEGVTLVGVYSAVNMLASALPGVGPAHRRLVADMRRHAVFGALVHDEGGGSVRLGTGREPILTYRMAPRDLARLRRSITILSEMAFAGGAREVYLPIFGLTPIKSMDEVRKLERSPLDARRIECLAFHPLGSARMATDARRGVVDVNGESYEVKGLYVADGSILPTSIGVNSQVPIMAMATRLAWRLADKLTRRTN